MNMQRIIFFMLCATFLFGKEADEQTLKEKSLAAGVSYDVCDTSNLYGNEGYSYSLPKDMLSSFLAGNAFGRTEAYSPEELENLKADIREIFAAMFSGDTPTKEQRAVMTAGAPGSGKTLLMRSHLAKERAAGKNFPYDDPDDVCLKSQRRTFQVEVAQGDGSAEARLAAYNKWRPGSNAAAHLILGNLIREQYGFYFGTTSTGPVTWRFLDFLKSRGYQIELIYISAPDEVRWGSLKERDKEFIQTTERDVIEKALLLPQRINDYLKYADRITFYYRDEIKSDARLAARWTREEKPSEGTLGTLEVVSPADYEHIKTIHNAAIEQLGMAELKWEETLEKKSARLAG